jgi:hypothetical protein
VNVEEDLKLNLKIVMCKWGITKKLFLNGRIRNIDSCIYNMVKMFNDNGYKTVACCCGHGKQPPRISLKDGREILIFNFNTANKIAENYPPINK